MSLFSFDVRDEGDSFEDEDGIECATLKRGRIPHGFRSALLAWEMLPDSPHRSFVVKVRDDTGKQVFRDPRFGLDSR